MGLRHVGRCFPEKVSRPSHVSVWHHSDAALRVKIPTLCAVARGPYQNPRLLCHMQQVPALNPETHYYFDDEEQY
jgi:hypothetical protein